MKTNPDIDIVATLISSRDNNGHTEPLFGLSPGVILVPYKSSQIEIEIIESEIFKSAGSGLSKWIDINVSIFVSDRMEAQQIFTDFINDALNMMQHTEEFKLSVQIYDPKSG